MPWGLQFKPQDVEPLPRVEVLVQDLKTHSIFFNFNEKNIHIVSVIRVCLLEFMCVMGSRTLGGQKMSDSLELESGAYEPPLGC